MDEGEAEHTLHLPLWNHPHSVAPPCTQGEPHHLDPLCPPFGTTRYRFPGSQGPRRVVPWGTFNDV